MRQKKPGLIARRLKIAREKCCLTQAAASRLSGISSGALSQYESGHTQRPGAQNLRVLAALYGVTIEWLLGGEE